MKLSDRLQAVASFVTPGLRVVDIGTDHGYIPIYLTEQGIIPYAIAMDINKGPILRAQENIKENSLEKFIETRLSNGFDKLEPGEADCAVIAGMGGELITNILNNGRNVVDGLKELVLSPHSEVWLVRKYLHNNDFKIIDEKMIIDEGKFYTIIKVVKGKDEIYSEEDYMYGKILIEKKDEVLMKYIFKEYNKVEKIFENISKNGTDNAKSRIAELEKEKKMLTNVMNKLENGD